MSRYCATYSFTKLEYDLILSKDILKDEVWRRIEEVNKYNDWEIIDVFIVSRSSKPKVRGGETE